MTRIARFTFFVLLVLSPLVAVAAGSGYIGIAVAVDGEGFFLNPTLKSVRVARVAAASPAANAGMSVGDDILEVEGHPVAGARASDLKPYLERAVGQSTRFVIRKATGEVRQITVVAGPKP